MVRWMILDLGQVYSIHVLEHRLHIAMDYLLGSLVSGHGWHKVKQIRLGADPVYSS